MKLKKIKIKNFRILQNLDLDIEDDLSLILGKNNCGKTSLLAILEKFIGSQRAANPFSYHDFNCHFRKELYNSIEKGLDWGSLDEKGIELYIYIQYGEDEDISNLQPFMLDLDPENDYIVLKFEYMLNEEKYKKLVRDFNEFRDKNVQENKVDIFRRFIQSKHKSYFTLTKKAVGYDPKDKKIKESEFVEIKNDLDIAKVLSFHSINAKRDAINNEGDHSLSDLSSLYYEKTKVLDSNLDDFERAILDTDKKFTNEYDRLFESVIRKVKTFGGIRQGDTQLKIISTLSQRQLLKGNTTVIYEEEDIQFPESFNGLGYLNLIGMIMEIEIYIQDFLKKGRDNESPAHINLLFIEEPEAHTHPQLQYIFIKNIKNMLRESTENKINLQTIITTHSSHIVTECDFDDIKYLKKADKKIEAKNLKDLKIEYRHETDPKKNHYKFLKQYLTLNCAEIFFADKAILIEGDTERLLLPAMMKKIDQEYSKEKNSETELLSQNISLIPIGAYFHIFEKFLIFIGIKTLIITDLDAVQETSIKGKNGITSSRKVSCKVENGEYTSNSTLKYFYGLNNKKNQIEILQDKKGEDKILSYDYRSKKWKPSPDGLLRIAYQTKERGYNATSFEDAFINVNTKFLKENIDCFESIKSSKKEKIKNDDEDIKPYEIAQECILGKTTFALDILLNSEEKEGKSFSNWVIPEYIKEGLLWIKKS
ncbi:ATP-dependent nuclease [Dubosiella newyorkensis]|uniref:ATP-dependent nuclease n=1 Tax=Dubosiella newyorkensis TaxID=1862672 RepID=UPI0023F25160|nr:ATP-dependent endonuclease [Dubosiella newyorkensis]